MNGGQHVGHARQHLPFLFSDGARRLLDPPRVEMHDQEQDRRDRERHQREPPTDVEHHADRSSERQHVDEDPEQRRIDEVLNRGDVARHPHHEVARARLVMFGERQPLNVLVDAAAQIVSHPLGDTRRQVFLEVAAERIQQRDERDRRDRHVQRRVPVAPDDTGDGLQP